MERVASPASDAARRTAVEGAPTSPQTERRGPQPLAFGERRVDTPVRVTRGSRVSYEYPSGSTWDRYQKDPVYREQQALRYLETGGREGFMPARDRLALAAAQSRSRALDTIATQEFNRLMPAVVEAQNAIQEARAKRDVKALADAQARYNAANAQLYQFLRIINRNTPSPYDFLQQPQQPQQLKQKQ